MPLPAFLESGVSHIRRDRVFPAHVSHIALEENWKRGQDLNLWPPDYESDALPAAPPRNKFSKSGKTSEGKRLPTKQGGLPGLLTSLDSSRSPQPRDISSQDLFHLRIHRRLDVQSFFQLNIDRHAGKLLFNKVHELASYPARCLYGTSLYARCR
jgi:hypothetical protein